MKRATKILLAVAGVILLSYPAMAWVTGIVIESRVQHYEQQVLDRVPYLTLVKREYHRGVYRSTETVTYEFHLPAPAVKAAAGARLPEAVAITVMSNIEHGPLPGLHGVGLAVIDSRLLTPPALQETLQGALGTKPLLQVHSMIGLFGGAAGTLTSPAFSLKLPDASTLAWGGLRGTAVTSRGMRRGSGQFSAPRLAFGNLELTGMEYSGSSQKTFGDLYLGDGTFTIERIAGRSLRSGDSYSLQRVSATTTAKTAGDFFDMRVDLAADSAKLASLTLSNIMYSESFEHLHGPTFAAMMQAVRQAEHRAGASPAQLQTGLHDAFRRYGGDLLLHDPVINIRQVSFSMPEGSFRLSAKVSAPGLSRSDLEWPAAIVALETHARVTADLRIDNGLLQKLLAMGGSRPNTAAQLASLEQQGYLTAGSGAVTTHLDYSGGRLTLNGHPFPPAAEAN